MSIRDMARTALGDDPRADYNPADPDGSNYRQHTQAARAIHAATYPPHKVTEPAAVFVTITSTSFGGEVTIHDNRNEEND